MTPAQVPADPAALASPHPGKRPYAAPVLSFFGQVAAITQSGSGCTDDNAICQPPATNMGPSMGSDRRLKENIVQVGTHPLGIGLYLFEYKAPHRDLHGAGRHFGVMADEVEQVMPEAIRTGADGYLAVDYGLLGIRHTLH
jgi:hypothetical protein